MHDIDLRELLPGPPPWRAFMGGPVLPTPPEDEAELARRLGPVENVPPRRPEPKEAVAVNAALYLRRPLLVTGPPGVGKSSLAYRVSRELRLGPVLRWPINSRSTLGSGLYEYDAIARVRDAAHSRAGLADFGADRPDPIPDTSIGDYLQLGPLGTALLPYELPRVLLVDELDKSDIDLPNDLLDVLEEGEYRITELFRIRGREPVATVHTADAGVTATIERGIVRCRAFPFIVITSNGEREFPPAFLRRCIQLRMDQPDADRLAEMVRAHFARRADEDGVRIIREFLEYQQVRSVAADQLLNAVFLAVEGVRTDEASWNLLLDIVLQGLGKAGPQ